MTDGQPRNSASTSPASSDSRLRGRTYAITFERVWKASLELADGDLRRWRMLRSDDEQGDIVAQATGPVWRRPSTILIRIGLDDNGQTRVDLHASLKSRLELGSNARRIDRFLRALDAKLAATPAQILDATREPAFSA